MDAKPYMNPFHFWFPVLACVGASPPRFWVPYFLVYYVAFFLELVYQLTGLEPLFTRLETSLMALTNTYSTKKAEHLIGYRPRSTEKLMRKTTEFFRLQHEHEAGRIKLAEKSAHALDYENTIKQQSGFENFTRKLLVLFS